MESGQRKQKVKNTRVENEFLKSKKGSLKR